MTSLLSAQNLGIRLGNRQILSHVTLALEAKQIVSLVGPNGAGKTTLLRALLGLIEPSTGQVIRAPELRLGYVPQRLQIDALLPLTVERFLKLWPGATAARIESCLEQTGAIALRQQPVQRLSGGEFQRVLLARALLNAPNLLVLDEPAQGMDMHGQAGLYALIAKLRDETGCGVLMVSHDLHVVMRQTDHVICLNQHICCAGHPEQVGRDPAYTALFGNEAQAFALYHHHHDHHHD